MTCTTSLDHQDEGSCRRGGDVRRARGCPEHASKSGVAHLTAPDEESALEDARYLLSFLPQSNAHPAPFDEPTDPIDREAPELDGLIPDEPTSRTT